MERLDQELNFPVHGQIDLVRETRITFNVYCSRGALRTARGSMGWSWSVPNPYLLYFSALLFYILDHVTPNPHNFTNCNKIPGTVSWRHPWSNPQKPSIVTCPTPPLTSQTMSFPPLPLKVLPIVTRYLELFPDINHGSLHRIFHL